MSTEITQLQPLAVWKNFKALNDVPRPSKREERVIAFMQDFGKRLGLETYTDKVGNVIVKKPASPGMENRKTVIIQSHLDMVHQKNNDTVFDFETQPIEMYVDGDWVKAKGTTLGADNGMGVAAIMALLESNNIPHPPIEALFTIDEETGMTGAKELEKGILDGTILLNLDTEDDDELTIGCAGGVDITATHVYEEVAADRDAAWFEINLKGLSGGHSGMDINKGLANANKLLVRMLWNLTHEYGISLGSFDGGSLRNAIPREAKATFAVEKSKVESLRNLIKETLETLKKEYGTTDPNLTILMSETTGEKVMKMDAQKNMLAALYACDNGIYRMSPDMPGLVQTSSNLARVEAKGGSFSAQFLTRSSVESEKWDMAEAIKASFVPWGCEVTFSGNYPGWAPAPSSELVKTMDRLYREMFAGEPKVMACHAGLECGLLGERYPGLDMISFGPNIRGAHSPDEKVQISSVQKFWKFLLETLEQIPERN